MILVFPNLDTLRLVVTTGLVPGEVVLAPARVSTDADGRLFVETDAKLTKKVRDNLDRLNVVGTRRHATESPEDLSNWLQIIPVTREPGPLKLAAQSTVLFQIAPPELLPEVVGELLRLGNDRQSYRVMTEDGDNPSVLLRVIGPPYYTLLRALDRLDGPGSTIRAYVEQAPRVWVELGHHYEFASQIRLADGQLLLIRSPRDWVYVTDEPFLDVYELLQFQLPSTPVEWKAVAVPGKFSVPLRLAAGNAADLPELWLVRGEGLERLDALVRDSDDRLTEPLTFAVVTSPDGTRAAVIRTRPSRKQPPVLAIEGAIGFKPYWKLPNLYLPVGTRLHPTVRRETVRRLLAENTDTLVWLNPGVDGSFVPEAIPEDSFRPLADWVDYVIDSNREALAAWVAATEFDFDSFVCTDASAPRAKPPAKNPSAPERDATTRKTKPPATQPIAKPTEIDDPPPAISNLVPLEVRPPSEWQKRLAELESQFFAVDGPLDAAERVRLWPELAAANAGIGPEKKSDAAVCWLNALWGRHALSADWLAGWLRTEVPGGKASVTAAELDQRMKSKEPTPGEMRVFAASLLWVAWQSPLPTWLKDRLPAIQRYLAAHDKSLPIRAAWLAAVRLAQLTGADVLGLARVRDRLLQRLLETGLNPEQDLPTFLRFDGARDAERLRTIRDKAIELHQTVRKWAETSLQSSASVPTASDPQNTLAYIDLMFAFGLARLGESTAARTVVETARKVLVQSHTSEEQLLVGRFLFKAFSYRIETALAGKPHGGSIDPALLAELHDLKQKANAGGLNHPLQIGHYSVTRIIEQSRILDPHEKLDPYARITQGTNELLTALYKLTQERDPNVIVRTTRELYKNGLKGHTLADVRYQLLHAVLPISTRAGEAFSTELLKVVPEVLREPALVKPTAKSSVDMPEKLGELLERALFLAAHFDRTEFFPPLIDEFLKLVHALKDEQKYVFINSAIVNSFRSLHRLGMRDEIDKLLHRLQDEILHGQSITQARERYKKSPKNWAHVLQTFLNLAGGWLTFGMTQQANAILATARVDIFDPVWMLRKQSEVASEKISSLEYTRLASAYVAALSHGPADYGLPRIAELFQRLGPNWIQVSFTSSPYYSRLHLNLVEEVVLALVSDDFALGRAGHRWLDADEFLVRRRIHLDLRKHLETSSL